MKTKIHHDPDPKPKSGPEAKVQQQIALRAYDIWLASGGRHGDDVSHWLQAETEWLQRQRQAKMEPHRQNSNSR
jgi:hypothetical protein